MIDGWLDGWINGWMDGLIKWSMNRWIDELSTATPPPSCLNPPATTDFTDSNTCLPQKDIVNAACLCFGSVSAVPLISSSSLEWRSLSARECGANLAVPIRTMTLCKCRYLCYMLSCKLVGRLSNLKRWKLSTAHMPGRWRGGSLRLCTSPLVRAPPQLTIFTAPTTPFNAQAYAR